MNVECTGTFRLRGKESEGEIGPINHQGMERENYFEMKSV
jgi:hypothetical protein